MLIWYQIISELFINLAAGWFAVVFIEPQLVPVNSLERILPLIAKSILGILSLFAAKFFREKTKRRRR